MTVLTVFRSRLADGAYDAGYEARAEEMLRRARSMPGFLEFKSFTEPDGERVSIIGFATIEDQRAWARDAQHLAAQREGREAFYAEYRIVVAEVISDRSWPHG